MSHGGSRKRVWLIRFGIALIGVPVLCAIACYIAFAVLIGGEARKLPGLRREAKAMGIPLEAADFDPNPAIPDSENAATVYKLAFAARYSAQEDDPRGWLQTSEFGLQPQTPEDVALARRALGASGHVVALLARAAAMDRCYFAPNKRDTDPFPYAGFDGADMQSCTHIATGRALIQAASGDVRGAFKALVVAARMARHAGQSADITAAFEADVIEELTLGATMHIVADRPRDLVAILGAERVVDALGPVPLVRPAIAADVPLFLSTIRKIHTWTAAGQLDGTARTDELPGPFDRFLISTPTFEEAGEAKYLEAMTRMIRSLPSDPDDWRGFRDAMIQMTRSVQTDHSLTNRVARKVFFVLADFPIAMAAMHGHENLAATALRLLAIRASGKQLPETLPDFGRISVDPIDGKPLRYERVGSGFKLWTLSRDLVDRSGKFDPRAARWHEGYDNVLEFK